MYEQWIVNGQRRRVRDITSEVVVFEPEWKKRFNELQKKKRLESLSIATSAQEV